MCLLGGLIGIFFERGLQCPLCGVVSRTGSEDRAICWAGRLSHFLLSRVSYPPPCPQPEASSHPNGSRAPTEGSFPFGNAAGFLVLGVSLERTKMSAGLFGPRCTPQMGREPQSVWAGYAHAAAQSRKLRSFSVAGRGYCTASKQQGEKVGRRQRRRQGKKHGRKKKPK